MTDVKRFVVSLGPTVVATALGKSLNASLLRLEQLAENDSSLPGGAPTISELVILFASKLSSDVVRFFQTLSCNPQIRPVRCVCVFTTLGAHYGDRAALELEDFVRLQVLALTRKPLFIRTGRLVKDPCLHSDGSAPTMAGCMRGLLPKQMGRVVVSFEQLSEVIQSFFDDPSQRRSNDPLSIAVEREITLLGPYQYYDSNAGTKHKAGWIVSLPDQFFRLVGFLGVRQLIWLILLIAARFRPSLREMTGKPIQPRSNTELLRLYHPWNRQFLQTVGMNIGVRHFGWKFPHRVLIQTTAFPLWFRWTPGRLKVNAGAALKHCVHSLRTHGEQLLVVPNFTWVSAGTAFFVPIHGSASSVSMLGQSIESALLFDGESRCFVRIQRGDGQFEKLMYRPERLLVLLRLEFRTEPGSKYSKQTENRKTPDADEIWRLFFQSEYSHMELRKKHSKAPSVDISRFLPASQADKDSMDMPRDQIGQLWDRIEETPVVSWLFHELVKRYAFHVELFLDRSEFEEFWRHHERLPLLKIQLRRVNADGMLHSPVCREDRISADLFMKKDDRNVFCSFVDKHIPQVRWNPGKQSL